MAVDTPEVSNRKSFVRDIKQGVNPGGNWDDDVAEVYFSAEEKHASMKKAKKRGPSNQTELSSVRAKRGTRTPDCLGHNTQTSTSTPDRSRPPNRRVTKTNQSFEEKGNRKI